jgi:hypothetical protein
MKQCACGSYAINHHSHGRDGSDADLCDVCYWRTRAERLRDERNQIIEQCAEVCEQKRAACQAALALLGEHETVARACAKSRIQQAEDDAAAIRALKEQQ